MTSKLDIDRVMAGVFEDAVYISIHPTFPDAESVTMVVEMSFEYEFDLEDRERECNIVCDRVREGWGRLVKSSPQFPEMADMKFAVLLKFKVVAHDYRND